MPGQTDIVRTETFAPLLYVMAYDDFDEAIALHNGVPQGLASSIFTTDVREAERFMSAAGQRLRHRQRQHRPSGAEIGGAFGGEKATGGGRESGSDAWKALHAPGDEHDQLLRRAPPRPRRPLRRVTPMPFGLREPAPDAVRETTRRQRVLVSPSPPFVRRTRDQRVHIYAQVRTSGRAIPLCLIARMRDVFTFGGFVLVWRLLCGFVGMLIGRTKGRRGAGSGGGSR